MTNYTIRLETPADYAEVENLVREAFWNVYRQGCTEHFVLHHLRANKDFIPELAFIMEEKASQGNIDFYGKSGFAVASAFGIFCRRRKSHRF